MSSRKRGQANRDENENGIIYVTIQIVPTDMICRVEHVDKGREVQLGRELKMGIIHVTIQIVPTDMICRVETWTSGTRGTSGMRIKNRNNSCYNTNCSF